MSFDALRWALEQPVRPAARKLVLIVVADHADRDGFAWPSAALVAARCGLDVSNVRRHLAALVKAGQLASIDRPRRPDGTLGVRRYQVPCDDQRARAPRGPARVSARDHVARDVAKDQVTSARQRTRNQIIEPVRDFASADDPAAGPLWITNLGPTKNATTTNARSANLPSDSATVISDGSSSAVRTAMPNLRTLETSQSLPP